MNISFIDTRATASSDVNNKLDTKGIYCDDNGDIYENIGDGCAKLIIPNYILTKAIKISLKKILEDKNA